MDYGKTIMLPYPGVIRPKAAYRDCLDEQLAICQQRAYQNSSVANTLPRDIELYEGSDGELYLAATPAPK